MKRVIDLLISGVGLIVLSPALAAVAVWIKLDSAGPVFHRGLRVGQRAVLRRLGLPEAAADEPLLEPAAAAAATARRA